ncbi:MAG: TonB-dependent receptor, partial [Novosphingobium sp.]
EAGIKAQLFDRKLRLNLSAFHYDIANYQIRSVVSGLTLLRNAGKVKVDGFELEFDAVPTDRLRLFGGFSVLNSRFTEFPGAVFQYANPVTCAVAPPGAAGPGVTPGGTTPGATPTGGLSTCYGDAAGNRTMLSPKFAASLGASYRIPVNAQDEIRLNALYSYNSGFTFEPDQRLRQQAFHVLNASIEYSIADKWKIELWAKNLTDTEYYVQRQSSDVGAYGSLAAPRTYGINLKFDL